MAEGMLRKKSVKKFHRCRTGSLPERGSTQQCLSRYLAPGCKPESTWEETSRAVKHALTPTSLLVPPSKDSDLSFWFSDLTGNLWKWYVQDVPILNKTISLALKIVQKDHNCQNINYLKWLILLIYFSSTLNAASPTTVRLWETSQRIWKLKGYRPRQPPLPYSCQHLTPSPFTHAACNNDITNAAITMAKEYRDEY